MKKLSFQERSDFGVALRRFVKDHPEIEDATGYSQGYYIRLIDSFIRTGMPKSTEAQESLYALIREVF